MMDEKRLMEFPGYIVDYGKIVINRKLYDEMNRLTAPTTKRLTKK